MADWLSIGECMAELAPAGGRGKTRRYRLGFGGDTLNTAVYLARLAPAGVRVGYLTRLGDDPFSAEMLSAWAAEGIDTSLVEVVPGRTVGLYAISLDPAGERSFTYWRGEAPARELFGAGAVEARLAAIERARLVYFSGITLAILGDQGRRALIAAAGRAKTAGAAVAFDPNFRPALWPGRGEAAAAFAEALRAATIALVGLDDARALGCGEEAAAVASAIAGHGASEVVVKAGPDPARVVIDGRSVCEIAPAPASVIDTTGAGDAFNGAYLAARLAGGDPAQAIRAGHELAARVVGVPGAIVPR